MFSKIIPHWNGLSELIVLMKEWRNNMNSLSENEIGDAGAVAIADALKDNKTLKSLLFVSFCWLLRWINHK